MLHSEETAGGGILVKKHDLLKSDSYSKVGVRIEPVYATSFAILDLNICHDALLGLCWC